MPHQDDAPQSIEPLLDSLMHQIAELTAELQHFDRQRESDHQTSPSRLRDDDLLGEHPVDEQMIEDLHRQPQDMPGHFDLDHQDDRSVSSWATFPPVDVIERDDAFVVKADLAGFKKNEIDLELINDLLEIEATRDTNASDDTDDVDSDDEAYFQHERPQSVTRTVVLPGATTTNEITATYDAGVLTVTMPKHEPGDVTQQIAIE